MKTKATLTSEQKEFIKGIIKLCQPLPNWKGFSSTKKLRCIEIRCLEVILWGFEHNKKCK